MTTQSYFYTEQDTLKVPGQIMKANAYNRSFAVGYFYARAYPLDVMPEMPEEDLVFRNTQGFQDGMKAGREDFEQLDLPRQALERMAANARELDLDYGDPKNPLTGYNG